MKARALPGHLLSHRRLPLFLSLLAVLLALPSLRGGWQLDDLYHRWVLLGLPQGEGMTWSPWDLFSFIDGDAGRTARLMEEGLLPWWTLEELLLAFWRPLSVLTHRLDYLLWPGSAGLMHLHSLMWFGAVVAAAAVLYRRVLGAGGTAGLAALFYAVDDAHGFPAGWLANRNALVGTFFGLLCLIGHHRWRSGGWRLGALIAPAFCLLGLLGSEAALGVLAYLFAYALFIEEGPRIRRAASLLPYGAVAAVWLVLYHAGGYGARGSGFYVHPLYDPTSFAAAVAERVPVLLLGQWAWPPSGLYIYLSSPAARAVWLTALLFLVFLAALLIPLLRRERTARFWALGMILSILPVCATFPHDRLLLYVGLGAMGLLAQGVVRLRERLAAGAFRKALRPPVYALLVMVFLLHVLAASALLPLSALSPVTLEPLVNRPAKDLPDQEGLRERDLVIVNPPVPFFAGYLPTVRALDGQPLPRRLRILAPGWAPVDIDRLDEMTLSLRPAAGFLTAPFDELFRGKSHPMEKGQEVVLGDMTVTVTELTNDGRPAAASFRFEVPLEDAGLQWVQWKEGKYAPFFPPPEGGSLRLAGGGVPFLSGE